MWVFTAPALYTLCVLDNVSTAHTMWMPCYPDCTCTWENTGTAGALTSFNYWYLLSGVPAMFVTVWATVRAVYADTEWVCINHNGVIITFTQFVRQWARWAGESRRVEHSSSSVRGVIILNWSASLFLFVFYVSIFQKPLNVSQCNTTEHRFSNTLPLALAIRGVQQ